MKEQDVEWNIRWNFSNTMSFSFTEFPL